MKAETSGWRRMAQWAGHALALVTIGLCLLLPTSRYDWVGDVDPTISTADFVGGGDDPAVVIGAFAIVAVLIETVAVTRGRSRRTRIVPAVLIAAVAAAWLARSIG